MNQCVNTLGVRYVLIGIRDRAWADYGTEGEEFRRDEHRGSRLVTNEEGCRSRIWIKEGTRKREQLLTVRK